MRIITIIALILTSLIGFGQTKQKQLAGTHAFIDIPDSFSYFFDISGYADSLAGIFISAFRAPESLKTVKQQFSSQSQYEIVDSFKTPHMVVSSQLTKGGRSFTNYTIPIGDKNESAMVTIVAENTGGNNKIVESLISSITWNSKSKLNFEEAVFFEMSGMENFEFQTKMYNNFTFTSKKASFPNPEFTLRIGTNIMMAPFDEEGQQRNIIEYLINPSQDLVFTLSKEFQNQIIDNRESVTVKWTYEQDDKTIKLYFTTIFTSGRVYFIEAKSSNREFDYLFDDYEDMISSFRLKI